MTFQLASPALLAGLVFNSSVYVIGRRIQELKVDVKADLKSMKADLTVIEQDLRRLEARQAKLERHHMALVEWALANCGTKR